MNEYFLFSNMARKKVKWRDILHGAKEGLELHTVTRLMDPPLGKEEECGKM